MKLVEDRVRQGLAAELGGFRHGLAPLAADRGDGGARRAEAAADVRSEITETGVRWEDGTTQRADVILWCTGFRSSLDHLALPALREPSGGILMGGRLATEVVKDPRIHLVGYGPSASTIGANWAGAVAASEIMATLGIN